MIWTTILAILIGLLINLIFNYLTSQDLLKDPRNKKFYFCIWILTAVVLIIARATPEWTTETTLLFYTVIGFSLPQMLLSILANNNYKDTNEKLKQKEREYELSNILANNNYKDINDKLKQKEKDCENLLKNYENLSKRTVGNLTVCDKLLVEQLCGKDIDTKQIMKIFESRSENLQLLETFTEKARQDYLASISVAIGDVSGVKPPTNK